MPLEEALPFPRGQTLNDGAHSPLSAGFELNALCGRFYRCRDTLHGTNRSMILVALANETGGDITCTKDTNDAACSKFGEFKPSDADHDYYGKAMGTFPCNTAGAVAVPIDDHYAPGFTIPEHDVFWAIVYGPCYLMPASGSSLAANVTICTDANGKIVDAAAVAAGRKPLGVLGYADSYVGDTRVMVLVDVRNLLMPPAAG